MIVREEPFRFLAEGALYWPRHGWLVVADLHLGKAETFGESGFYLPFETQYRDLEKIRLAADRMGAREILFLGDLVHARVGVSSELRVRFGEWVNSFPGSVRMIVGNHDLGTVKSWPMEWSKVERVPEGDRLREGDFLFAHEPPGEGKETIPFTWAGHIHPCVRLELGPDRFRLPAFVVKENFGLLPAFSGLAGGYEIKRARGTRLYPTDGERIYSLSPASNSVTGL